MSSEQKDHGPLREYILDAYQRLLKPTPSVRFKSFPILDKCLGGLRPREYTILCGSTGSGKTSLLAALSVDLVMNGVPVYVASVETGPVDFINRMMSCLVKENWNLGDELPLWKIEDFQQRFPNFENVPLYLSRYEDRVSNRKLLGDIENAVQQHGVKIAILDNLNFFMEVTKSADTILEMDRVVHDAIIFCKQIDVHLIVVMHPRKTENSRVENEFDIKGSSTACQEAHNILLWNRPPKPIVEQDPIKYRNFREIKIAKCRRIGRYVGQIVTFYSDDGVSFIERPYDDIPTIGPQKNLIQTKRRSW